MNEQKSELFETEVNLNKLLSFVTNHTELVPRVGVYNNKNLLELIQNVQSSLLKDLKRAKEIRNMRDEIITNAQNKAHQIENDALQKANKQDFVIQAQREAKELLMNAEKEHDRLISEAKDFSRSTIHQTLQHSEQILSDAQNFIQELLQDTNMKFSNSRSELRNYKNNIENQNFSIESQV